MEQGSNSLAQSSPSLPAAEAAGEDGAAVATSALADASGPLLGDAAEDTDGGALSAGLAQPTIAAVTTSAPRMRIVRAFMVSSKRSVRTVHPAQMATARQSSAGR